MGIIYLLSFGWNVYGEYTSKENAIHDHPVGSVVTASKTPNMEAWSFYDFLCFWELF